MLIPDNWLEDIAPKRILHVGANDGEERDIYDAIGADFVLWVEARPLAFWDLLHNLKIFPRQKAIWACVAETDGGAVRFNVTSNNGASSSLLELGTHAEHWPEIDVVAFELLTTIKLDTLIGGVHSFDFLTMDIQGAELLALAGGLEFLACESLRHVYLEVNFEEVYVGCGQPDEIDALLKRVGFKHEFTIKRADGKPQGEALYARK